MTSYKLKNNVRGFTLIELLAVIVVLAVVMLIAVQAIMPRMESARKQAFAIEANGLIEAAKSFIVTESLTSSSVVVDATNGRCVEVEELVTKGYSELDVDKYSGKVMIYKTVTDNLVVYTYSVYLSNGQFMVNGKGIKDNKNYDIAEEHVEDSAVSLTEFGSSTTYGACSTTNNNNQTETVQ